jgi:predicted MFS family arabinose efflux permease
MKLPTAAPDGLIAAVLLSFLATAGLFYVNIMPALVAGLVDGLHFTNRAAGQVASANVYGAALGALIAVFVVRRIAWRRLALAALIGLIAADLASTLVTSADMLTAARFAHGTIGGILIGTAFAVIARTKVPDRTFGMLLVVQFGLGGVGLMLLPRLVPLFGAQVLFLALALFSAVTLAMVPFLAEYPPRRRDDAAEANPIRLGPLAAVLVALFLFQSGNMALAAYMIGLGRSFGLETGFISDTLGIAGWVAALGSLAVVFLETRFGRAVPLAGALVVTVIGNYLFHWSASATVFAIANAVTGVTWAFVVPYLLGMSASFDPSGQTATVGGFFSKMGLASGPLVGGMVLNETRYGLLIDVSVLVLAASALATLVPAILLDRSIPSRRGS